MTPPPHSLLRVACAAGFSGNRTAAASPLVDTLIAAGGPAVLIFETLAERTLALAQLARQFAHRRPTRVRRHLLPTLHAMNFVLDGVLDGGVIDSLNLDSPGKALSFLLLDLPIQVPATLATHLISPTTTKTEP